MREYSFISVSCSVLLNNLMLNKNGKGENDSDGMWVIAGRLSGKVKITNFMKGECAMRKNVWYLVTVVGAMMALTHAATEQSTAWNPGANPANDPNSTFAWWTDAANWTGTIPEGGPDNLTSGDGVFYKVQFYNSGAKDCYLNTKKTVGHLVAGDGGVNPGILHLLPGAELYAGYKSDGGKVWTGCGFGGQGGGIVVHKGALLDTYDHLWIAHNENAEGGLTVDGGTVICHEMFGMNFDGKATTKGYCNVKDGLLHLMNWNNTQSIRGRSENMNMDIEKGTVIIRYWRLDLVNACDPGICAQDGRITGYKNANFDKKINVEGGAANNAQNDIINNVKFSWDAANNQTILTAIHPVQPEPYFDETLQIGDVTLEWNNWDPNHAEASVLVDVWFGTEPNKLGTSFTKVVSGADVTGMARSSFVVNAPLVGTYYWQVDTYNGASEVHEGDVFSFNATNDLPPVVDAGSGYITWIGEPVTMNATVTDEASPALTWTSAPIENVTFSDAGIEDSSVTFAATGTYTLTLTANDGFNPAVSDTVLVTVYADACSAARDGTNNRPATDILVDCIIDINDFAELASQWLVDYALTVPVTN